MLVLCLSVVVNYHQYWLERDDHSESAYIILFCWETNTTTDKNKHLACTGMNRNTWTIKKLPRCFWEMIIHILQRDNTQISPMLDRVNTPNQDKTGSVVPGKKPIKHTPCDYCIHNHTAVCLHSSEELNVSLSTHLCSFLPFCPSTNNLSISCLQ